MRLCPLYLSIVPIVLSTQLAVAEVRTCADYVSTGLAWNSKLDRFESHPFILNKFVLIIEPVSKQLTISQDELNIIFDCNILFDISDRWTCFDGGAFMFNINVTSGDYIYSKAVGHIGAANSSMPPDTIAISVGTCVKL